MGSPPPQLLLDLPESITDGEGRQYETGYTSLNHSMFSHESFMDSNPITNPAPRNNPITFNIPTLFPPALLHQPSPAWNVSFAHAIGMHHNRPANAQAPTIVRNHFDTLTASSHFLNSVSVSASQAAMQLPLQFTNATSAASLPHPSLQFTNAITSLPPSSNYDHTYCKLLCLDQDEDNLSPYQCLVRQQIELFEATQTDLHAKSQGRNRPIVVKQIGIRCKHCGRKPAKERAKGAVFFPSQLVGLYQTAQNMANKHLLEDCREMPKSFREDLNRVRLKEKGSKTRKSAYGGGRHYWADCLRVLGVEETPDRRLRRRVQPRNPV